MLFKRDSPMKNEGKSEYSCKHHRIENCCRYSCAFSICFLKYLTQDVKQLQILELVTLKCFSSSLFRPISILYKPNQNSRLVSYGVHKV